MKLGAHLEICLDKSLAYFANLYGTDKGTVGPIPEWQAHNYTDVYEAYFERLRYSAINILEIGVGIAGNRIRDRIVCGRNKGGASLHMWRDYFPGAKIFGIDVNECSFLDSDRIKTFVADQGNVHELCLFTETTRSIDFDIIVDDGSHRPDHQQISLGYFFKHLKRGGFYCIEDLLANGCGDGAKGYMSCDNVINTRSVLKRYLSNQRFPEPNALTDHTYLADHIDYVGFYIPEVDVRFVFSPNRRRLFKRLMYHKPDTESLCIIRKK
jgi:hypothetical protein